MRSTTKKNAWCYYTLVRELETFLGSCEFFDGSVFCYEETINLSSGEKSWCCVAIQVRKDVLSNIGVEVPFPTLELYLYSPHSHKTVGIVLDGEFFHYAQTSCNKDVFKELQIKTQAIKDFVDGTEGG